MKIFNYLYNKYLEFKYRKNCYYIPKLKQYNYMMAEYNKLPLFYVKRSWTQSVDSLTSILRGTNIKIEINEHYQHNVIDWYGDNIAIKYYIITFKLDNKYINVIPQNFKEYCILLNYLNKQRENELLEEQYASHLKILKALRKNIYGKESS